MTRRRRGTVGAPVNENWDTTDSVFGTSSVSEDNLVLRPEEVPTQTLPEPTTSQILNRVSRECTFGRTDTSRDNGPSRRKSTPDPKV